MMKPIKPLNIGGKTGFGHPKVNYVPQRRKGLGEVYYEGIRYNPESGEYWVDGEVVPYTESIQGVSKIRDKLNREGKDINSLKTKKAPPKGFLPLNEEGKKRIEEELGWFEGLLEAGSLENEKRELAETYKKLVKKDPEKAQEYAKKKLRYIHTKYPQTLAEDLKEGLFNDTFTKAGRMVRALGAPSSAVQIGLQEGAGALGAAAGTAVVPGAGTLAGRTAGRFAGAALAKKLIGEDALVAENIYSLLRQDEPLTEEQINLVKEEVSKGTLPASIADALLAGGVGGVGSKAFKKALGKGATKYTAKQLAKQKAKQEAIEKIANTRAGKVLDSTGAALTGSFVSPGIETMYSQRGVKKATEGRETTTGEDIESFLAGGQQGLVLGAGMSLPGAVGGLATKAGLGKVRAKRNKIVIDKVVDPMANVRSKATGETLEQARSAIQSEYNSLAKQNVDLADKASSDYGKYLNQIKQKKRQAKNPKEVNSLLDENESIQAQNNLRESSDEVVRMATDDDLLKPERVSNKKLFTPSQEDLNAIKFSSIDEGIDYIKNTPYDDSGRMTLFKSLIENKQEDLGSLRNYGYNTAAFRQMTSKDIVKETFSKVIGSKAADYDVISYYKNLKDVDQLKRFALETGNQKLKEIANDATKTPRDLVKALDTYFGKGVGFEVGYVADGKRAILNVMSPEWARKGFSKQSNQNRANHIKFLDNQLEKQFNIKPRKFKGSDNYNLSTDQKNILIKNIDDDLQGTGYTFDDINRFYKNGFEGQKGWGEDIGNLALADLATRSKFELLYHLENETKLTKKFSDNQLAESVIKEKFDSMTPEAQRAVDTQINDVNTTIKNIDAVQKIFDQEVGKLTGVKLGGFTKQKGVEGYIKMQERNGLMENVIKVAHFLDKDSMRRVIRHELGHFVVKKALNVKEQNMFLKSLSKDGDLFEPTVKYLKEKGYSDEQVKMLSENFDEMAANYIEGAWEGKIDTSPETLGGKIVDAFKKFFLKIKKAFTGNFQSPEDVVVALRAGELERSGDFKFTGEGVKGVKPGRNSQKFYSELPDEIRDAVTKRAALEQLDPELTNAQKAFEAAMYEVSNIDKQVGNPLLFKMAVAFGRNAAMVSRKYPFTRNIYNFISKADYKSNEVKRAFQSIIDPMKKMSKEEVDIQVLKIKDVLRNGVDLRTLKESDYVGLPIIESLVEAYKFVEQGAEKDVKKLDKIVSGLIEKTSKGESLSSYALLQQGLMDLSQSVVASKYKDFVKQAKLRGSLIAFGKNFDEQGNPLSPFDLPQASLDENTSYLRGMDDKTAEFLTDFLDDTIPAGLGGKHKPKEGMNPVWGMLLKSGYLLSLGLKPSLIAVNSILGGLGTAATAMQHGGIPAVISTIINYGVVTPIKTILGKKRTFEGVDGNLYKKAYEQGILGGKQLMYEGGLDSKARQLGNKKLNAVVDGASKTLDFINSIGIKANEMQRFAAFKTGLDQAKRKGIVGDNALFDYAVAFTNEATGDFRELARGSVQSNALFKAFNMFKSEPQYQFGKLLNMARENPKALAAVLGMYIGVSGASSVPFTEDMFDIINSVIRIAGGKGEIRTDIANTISNMTGVKGLGDKFVFGYVAPEVGIGYSALGNVSTLGLPNLMSEGTKKRSNLSGFDLPAALGIPYGVFQDLAKQGRGGSYKQTQMQTGILKRGQAIKRMLDGNNYKETGEYIMDILGLSTAWDTEKFYENQKYFETR